MVFGHDSFVWTPVQVINNAETVSGTMVFNSFLDDFVDTVDDIVDAIVPDAWIEEMSDTLKDIKAKVETISTWTREKYKYLTGSDKVLELKMVEWCCPNGTRQRIIYGKYEVSEETSARGGPKTIEGVSWNAGDEYIKAFKEQANGVTYSHGREMLGWETTGFIPRMYSAQTDGGKKTVAWDAPPFGAPPRIVEERVDGELTGNTQQLAPLTIQELIDDFLEEGDSIGPQCYSHFPDSPTIGCMNSDATNYNSNAVCPDGSCECGFDDDGKRRKFDDNGNCYTVPCHDQGEGRTTHGDGSCSSCKSGFVFKAGVYPKICGLPPVDCKVSAYTPYSECSADGKKTRTRTITVQPAHGGQSCETKYGNGITTILSQTLSCTYTPPTANGGTGGRSGNGDEPPEVEACDDENRETKDDGSCDTYCEDGYEFDDDDICVEIPDEEKGLPVGLILAGGVALALGAFMMMQKEE